ncbi:YEATS-associated helix-containing protein [Rhodocyclus tenuis]|uniref:YEATS-Like-Associating Three TM domain-containing protein n=1 Tax=Rhodocyclus tenuis TaxID=1066 RepID=A0A840FV43_RHOTE|nr:YEATS-associated helix-containing protein [Rhodocyclus tenuis]MBB4245967.1 hypothetical protein [Rhodocyclus tenuis]
MNPELQKSLQLAASDGALDSHLLLILLVMVAAGALAGVANYFLSERAASRDLRDVMRYSVLGVVAALTVPLFLNMISSNLIEASRTRPVELFVFGGFCLLYVVASRRLFENVALRLLGQVEQMKRQVAEIQPEIERIDRIERRQEEAAAEAATREQAEAAERQAAKDAEKDALSYNDIEIVRAIAEEATIYGNLAGLTEKTGLGRELVGARLVALKACGILETRINDRNVLHWYVSPKGKQLLDEILSGQDER